MVADEPEERRAGEERAVPDRGDDRDPVRGALRVVRGGAHADREAEGCAEPPQHDAEHHQGCDAGVDDDQHPGGRSEGRHQHGARAPEPVEHDGSAQATRRHRGHEEGEAEHADPVARVVPVHERERQPVVRRAFGERERQHHQPDRQRPRLEPGRGPGLRLVLGRLEGGRREAPGCHVCRGHGRSTEDDVVGRQRYVERRRDGSDAGTGEGAEAPPGMEARHDAAAEHLLDRGPFDVHADVPRAGPEPVAEQADGRAELGTRGREDAGQDQPEEHHPGTEPDDGSGAPALDQEAAGRHPRHRSDRDGQQEQTEPAVGQVERLPQVGHARDEGGKTQAVECEGGSDRVASGGGGRGGHR